MNWIHISDLLEQIVIELRSNSTNNPDPRTIPLRAPPVVGPVIDPVIDPTISTTKSYTLEDLQAVGKALIQAGRASELKDYLASKGLKSLSTAPKTLYGDIYNELVTI
jgi:hypothetical protein